jgi:hypothetical protein
MTQTWLKKVRDEPCLVCRGAFGGSDPHHLTIAGGRGTALRAGDEWAVPLCRKHHNELHAMGNEHRFWQEVMVDPFQWLTEFRERNDDDV